MSSENNNSRNGATKANNNKTLFGGLSKPLLGLVLGSMLIGSMLLMTKPVVASEQAPLNDSIELTDKSSALNAISLYQQAPISRQGFKIAGKIVEFAEQSKEVLVEVNAETTPWLTTERLPPTLKGAMLGAYVAGSIKPQLILEIKQTHHCDGAYEVKRILKLIDTSELSAEVRLALTLTQASLDRFACQSKKPAFI